MLFRNAAVYPLTNVESLRGLDIDALIEKRPFIECGESNVYSAGWIPPGPDQHDPLVYKKPGFIMLRCQIEEKSVPGATLKHETHKRVLQREEAEKRKVGRKETREIQDQVLHELLPRAFSKISVYRVLVDLDAGHVVVDASSAVKAEGVLSILRDTLGTLPTKLAETEASPQVVMGLWLRDQPPAPFSLGDACELKQPTGGSAKISKQALDCQEVLEHLNAGKCPQKLSLVWKDSVSFTLSESLALTKLAALDGYDEHSADKDAAQEIFESEAFLMVETIRGLFSDLCAGMRAN